MSLLSCVDSDFFDLVFYSVYRAIHDLLGEKTWDVVWRSGEIMYSEIKSRLGLSGERDPVRVLERIIEWLKSVGYVEDASIKRVSEDTIEYTMSTPVISRGAERLIRERRVPPHISTSILFAALREHGLKAELVGEPIFLPDGRAVERWRLTSLTSSPS